MRSEFLSRENSLGKLYYIVKFIGKLVLLNPALPWQCYARNKSGAAVF